MKVVGILLENVEDLDWMEFVCIIVVVCIIMLNSYVCFFVGRSNMLELM